MKFKRLKGFGFGCSDTGDIEFRISGSEQCHSTYTGHKQRNSPFLTELYVETIVRNPKRVGPCPATGMGFGMADTGSCVSGTSPFWKHAKEVNLGVGLDSDRDYLWLVGNGGMGYNYNYYYYYYYHSSIP